MQPPTSPPRRGSSSSRTDTFNAQPSRSPILRSQTSPLITGSPPTRPNPSSSTSPPSSSSTALDDISTPGSPPSLYSRPSDNNTLRADPRTEGHPSDDPLSPSDPIPSVSGTGSGPGPGSGSGSGSNTNHQPHLPLTQRLPVKRSHPHLPRAMDSFLHHLHTDPSASHITLSGEGAPVMNQSGHNRGGGKGKGKEVSGLAGRGGGGGGGEKDQEADPGLLNVQGSSPPTGRSPNLPLDEKPFASISSESDEAMEFNLLAQRRAKSAALGLLGKPLIVLPPSPPDALTSESDSTLDRERGSRMHRSLTAVAQKLQSSSVSSSTPQSAPITLNNNTNRNNRPPPIEMPDRQDNLSPSNVSTPSPGLPGMGGASGTETGAARDKALAMRGAASMQSAPRLRTRAGANSIGAKVSARPTTAPGGSQGMLKGMLPAQSPRSQQIDPSSPSASNASPSIPFVESRTRTSTWDGMDTKQEGKDESRSRHATHNSDSTEMSIDSVEEGTGPSRGGMLSNQSESSVGSDYFEMRKGSYGTPVEEELEEEDDQGEKWPAEGELPEGGFFATNPPIDTPSTATAPRMENNSWPAFLTPTYQSHNSRSRGTNSPETPGDNSPRSESPQPSASRRSTVTAFPRMPSDVTVKSPTAEMPGPSPPLQHSGVDDNSSDGGSCVNAFSRGMSEMVQGAMGENAANGGAGAIRAGNTLIVGSSGSFDEQKNVRRAVNTAPRHPGNWAGNRGFYASSPLGQSESADWRSFIQAYSEGRWDSAKVPQEPRSNANLHVGHAGLGHRVNSLTSQRSSDILRQGADPLPTEKELSLEPEKTGSPFGIAAYLANKAGASSSQSAGPSSVGSSSTGSAGSFASSSGTNATSSAPSTPSSTFVPAIQYMRDTKVEPIRRKTVDEKEEAIATARGTGQGGPMVASESSSDEVDSTTRSLGMKREAPGRITLSSASLAGAATVRLASGAYTQAAFDPLNLPSPERELVDPFASIPDSHQLAEDRRRRLSTNSDSAATSGAWLRPDMRAALPTIAASPTQTPVGETPPILGVHGATGTAPPISASAGRGDLRTLPSASAPLSWMAPGTSKVEGDYFGSSIAEIPPSNEDGTFMNAMGPRSQQVDPMTSEEESVSRRSSTSKPKLFPHSSHGASGSSDLNMKAVFHSHEAPAVLSSLMLEEDPILLPLPPGPHEATFQRLGYLPAPMPPNEAARLKALHRFNIMHTAQDANFDRIAHLAKLVFNCKIVLMALIDEKEQWHKVDYGMNVTSFPRESSFCGHAILAKSDEPLIILDALQDWRFAQNPNVVGPPYIRFYAGAPLRTADGHNIGSLCVIDTVPRTEFPPRQRLVLKEFAAIAVREMELWRDKTRLKARDRIQTSMEKFTRECLELDNAAETSPASAAAKMERVYQRAAKLVRRTLDVDGALVLDLSQFEVVESTDQTGSIKKAFQADPYEVDAMMEQQRQETYKHALGTDATFSDGDFTFGPLPPWVVLGASEPLKETPKDRSRGAVGMQHAKFSEFLVNNPEGRIYEHVVPSWIRHAIPTTGLHYAMIVPIFNIDKHPFALLVAYSCDTQKQFLEGFELQFLRAIGVVILSAVLKRRMVLADAAKSVFISSISHELRTPLHGILAAAELLADTPMDSNQVAFLQTVQACGNSLIETVNHVLDFTKLSGATKQNLENKIRPGSVNLAKLVEETVEGCWIGQRAKSLHTADDIGSFYSPPTATSHSSLRRGSNSVMPLVETVIDIGLREKGWQVHCEKGGIRRVLMNLIGNSLKFTTDGYVQVSLRELPHTPGSKTLPIEMAVIDTGKGISRNFLKEQLFHPFSQENPLQTGTGLGLAIVNSIVRSDSVNGKVDVWSSEGLGTEIKVTLNVEIDEPLDEERSSNVSSADSLFGINVSVALVCFRKDHRGINLSKELISGYATWWGFEVLEKESLTSGDIIMADEDDSILETLLKTKSIGIPVLILSTSRSARQSAALSAFLGAGGFAQMVFKPVGPARLEAALRACVQSLHHDTPSNMTTRSLRSDYFSPRIPPMHPARSPTVSDNSASHRQVLSRQFSSVSTTSSRPSFVRAGTSRQTSTSSAYSGNPFSPTGSEMQTPLSEGSDLPSQLIRRRSVEDHTNRLPPIRPGMAPRSTTYHDTISARQNHPRPIFEEGRRPSLAREEKDGPSVPGSPQSEFSTISLADGGVMLKQAAKPEGVDRERNPRIMLVDDNAINLQLLGAYLKKKGIPYQQCVNGQIAVDLFTNSPAGYWDFILMDISMPVMDGFAATRAIRKIESDRRRSLKDANMNAAAISASTPTLSDDYARRDSRDSIGAGKEFGHTSRIFALSGRATTDDKKQAFSAGVDGYLVKPVKLASLQLLFTKVGF